MTDGGCLRRVPANATELPEEEMSKLHMELPAGGMCLEMSRKIQAAAKESAILPVILCLSMLCLHGEVFGETLVNQRFSGLLCRLF